MYIRIYNNKNDSFYLVGRPSNVADPGFITTGIDGLSDLGANLSTISNAGVDGDIVNLSKLMPRPITVTLALHSTENASIDAVTNTLKRAFPLKSTASLEWEREDGTLLTISGIVDNIARPRFGDGSPSRTMQISIYCSDPLFRGVERSFGPQETTAAAPMIIQNAGEYPNGITIVISNQNPDPVPAPDVTLVNGGETQTLSFGAEGYIEGGESLTISTVRGAKKATTESADLTPYATPTSSWIAVPPGESALYISDQSLEVSAFFTPRYL